MQWNDNMDEAPRDGTEVLLYYRNFLGIRDLVVSGHWCGHGYDIDDTWEHRLGYGNPNAWMPLPEPPK